MTGFISAVCLLFSAVSAFWGGLLLARALAEECPGGCFLELRRGLFLWTQPLVEVFPEGWKLQVGGRDGLPAALGVVCLLAALGLSPWIALLGFMLPGAS